MEEHRSLRNNEPCKNDELSISRDSIERGNMYEILFWKNFFIKYEGSEKNDLTIRSTSQMYLSNVLLNDNVFSGNIRLDRWGCPHFSKKATIRLSTCGENERIVLYQGKLSNRKLDGYGKMILEETNEKYKGEIKKGKRSGRGIYSISDSMVYIGEWAEGSRNGFGRLKMIHDKKLLYEGFWNKNRRSSFGIQWFSNLCRYKGLWKRNRKNGFGKMVWYWSVKRKEMKDRTVSLIKKKVKKSVRSIYLGGWKKDLPYGYGSCLWFKKKNHRRGNNMKKQNHIFQIEPWDKYRGYWKKGEKNGYGIFYYGNGNKLISFWKKNKKNGLSLLLTQNGFMYLYEYKNNKLVNERALCESLDKNTKKYSSSLQDVMNLHFFKNLYELSGRNIEYIYKSIYQNFDILVDIYNYFKKKNKKKLISCFQLKHLRKLCFHLNIMDTDFTLYLLNSLVIDFGSYNEEAELYTVFQHSNDSSFRIDEKDLIHTFFNYTDRKNYSSMFRLNKKLLVGMDKKQREHMKVLWILTKDLLCNFHLMNMKSAKSFFKYYCVHSCHKEENKRIYKKIVYCLHRRNREKEHFLFYVLLHVLQCIPLLFYGNYSKHKKKQNKYESRRIKEKLDISSYVESKNPDPLKNPSPNIIRSFLNEKFIIYLKKLIMFTNVTRSYVHNETKGIHFNSFVSTLIHICIRLGNQRNVSHLVCTIMEKLKEFLTKKESISFTLGSQLHIKKRKRKKRKKDTMDYQKRKVICCSFCNRSVYKNCKKERCKKYCKFCVQRKQKMKKNFYDKELIKILKTFIHYFMFYFLLFQTNPPRISLFSTKVNISLRVKDILIFLFKIGVLKSRKRKWKVRANRISLINTCFYNKKMGICKNPKGLISGISESIVSSDEKETREKKNVKENKMDSKEKNSGVGDKVTPEKMNLQKKEEKKEITLKNEIGKEKKKKEEYQQKYKNSKRENKEDGIWEENNSQVSTLKQNISSPKEKRRHVKKENSTFINKFKSIFHISLLELLSIFSDIFHSKHVRVVVFFKNTWNLRKVKCRREKRKLHRYRRSNQVLHHYLVLQSNKKVRIDLFKKETILENRKQNFHNVDSNQVQLNNEKKRSKLKKEEPREFKKKKNKISKEQCEEGNKTNTNICSEQANENTMIMEKSNTVIGYIKRRDEMKRQLNHLKKVFYPHKTYISLCDFFNINVTPYEFLLFFIKTVEFVKRKNSLKASNNDLLYFLIFHILLYRSSLYCSRFQES